MNKYWVQNSSLTTTEHRHSTLNHLDNALHYRDATPTSYTDQCALPMWRTFINHDMCKLSKTLMPFWHIWCLPQPELTFSRSKLCWRASPLQRKEVAGLVAGGPPDCAIFSLSHVRITRWNQPQISQKPLGLKFIDNLQITYQEPGSNERKKEKWNPPMFTSFSWKWVAELLDRQLWHVS